MGRQRRRRRSDLYMGKSHWRCYNDLYACSEEVHYGCKHMYVGERHKEHGRTFRHVFPGESENTVVWTVEQQLSIFKYIPLGASAALKVSMPCGGAGVRFYHRPVQDDLVRRKRNSLHYTRSYSVDSFSRFHRLPTTCPRVLQIPCTVWAGVILRQHPKLDAR